MCDKSPHELHFFSSILEYDPGVFGFAAKAVRGHDHRKIVYVHLCHRNIVRSSKDLQEEDYRDVYSSCNTNLHSDYPTAEG